MVFRFLNYLVYWTEKGDQGVHKDYSIHYYDEH